MKTKLEMAHEYALQLSKNPSVTATHNDKDIASRAWDCADAMQAEADKRENEEQDKLKQDDINYHDALVEIGLEEWQPDWSQAPDNLVKYFAVDENGCGGWFISKPVLCSDHWYWSDFEEWVDNDHYDHAPSFGYTGDWRNSLRKRPQ